MDLISLLIEKFSRAQFNQIHGVSDGSFDFGVENLKNGFLLDWIFYHFSDFDFFDWFNDNVVFVILPIVSKLSLEDSGFSQILETPEHSSA